MFFFFRRLSLKILSMRCIPACGIRRQ